MTKSVQIILSALLFRGLACALQNQNVPLGALPGTKIMSMPGDPPLYEGDDIEEFLNLCPGGCSHNCPLVSLNPKDKSCTRAERLLLRRLRRVQKEVRAFQTKLKQPLSSSIGQIFVYILNVVVIFMGGFLICRKHFHYKTLWDKDFPDPTQGLPIWQYQRMRYAPMEVVDTRSQQVRIAEVRTRLHKKRAEREALKQLRQSTREQQFLRRISDAEQILMAERQREQAAAEHKHRSRKLVAGGKKHHAERVKSGAMSAKFTNSEDYSTFVRQKLKKANDKYNAPENGTDGNNDVPEAIVQSSPPPSIPDDTTDKSPENKRPAGNKKYATAIQTDQQKNDKNS